MSLCSRRQRQRELVCSSKCVREEESKMWKKRRESEVLIVRAVVAIVMYVELCVCVVFLSFRACGEIYLQVIRDQTKIPAYDRAVRCCRECRILRLRG